MMGCREGTWDFTTTKAQNLLLAGAVSLGTNFEGHGKDVELPLICSVTAVNCLGPRRRALEVIVASGRRIGVAQCLVTS
jgi:hypothetical protein